MDNKDIEKLLDEKFLQMRQDRHSVSANLQNVIGELEKGQSDCVRAVSALEKNYGELKIISENTKTIINESLTNIHESLRGVVKSHQEFVGRYNESPAVTDWKLKMKEIADLQDKVKDLSEANEKQNTKINKHERWFIFSFGALFTGQIIFKYAQPFIESWPSN